MVPLVAAVTQEHVLGVALPTTRLAPRRQGTALPHYAVVQGAVVQKHLTVTGRRH